LYVSGSIIVQKKFITWASEVIKDL
jgi:hypothetical protein